MVHLSILTTWQTVHPFQVKADVQYHNNMEHVAHMPFLSSTGGVPSDGTPIYVPLSYHLALVIIYDFLAILGIIFTIVCFLFNIIFRKRKYYNIIIKVYSLLLNFHTPAGLFD